MATIDLSDIVDDVDFDMEFRVVQAIEIVGSNGRATFTNKTIKTHGSVQPATPRGLQLLPDSVRVEGALTIYTRYPLRINDGVRAADTVLWEGRRYVVSNVQPWSQWGRGFINATCTLHDLTDQSQPEDSDGDEAEDDCDE
jgi:galactose-6-phosphate isomerase